MRDLLDNPINLGDLVAFIDGGYRVARHLRVGYVTGFSPKKVRVDDNEHDLEYMPYPSDVVVITRLLK